MRRRVEDSKGREAVRQLTSRCSHGVGIVPIRYEMCGEKWYHPWSWYHPYCLYSYILSFSLLCLFSSVPYQRKVVNVKAANLATSVNCPHSSTSERLNTFWTHSRKSSTFVRQCGKYGTAREATDNNVIGAKKGAVFMKEKQGKNNSSTRNIITDYC